MPKSFIYNSKDKLGNTDLYVNAGDKLSISATIIEPWKDFWIPSSLDGFNFPFKFLFPARWRNEKYYCLCGCIGKEEEYYFKIGSGITNFEVAKSGTFYVFVNDYNADWAYSNNKGKVKLNITVI